MKIENSETYIVYRKAQEYVREMSGGLEDKKSVELIATMKLCEEMMIEDMFKANGFNVIERMYRKMGKDEMFSNEAHVNLMKEVLATLFSY